MTFVDPKTGRLLWKANVRQGSAEPAADGSVTGTLEGVVGILYQNGTAQDNLKAQTVKLDTGRRVVVASGGVEVTSLTQRASSLTCDTVTWYTAENRMIGVGHVVFRTGGFTQTGPSFLADTKMKQVVMPAPGRSAARSVHVTFQH